MTRLLAILAACSITLSMNAQQLRMLVGTYTENTPAEGVYLYSFNAETAEAELLDCAPSGNPSFVIASPDGKRAYAVNEYNDGRQGVSSFVLEEKSIVQQSNLLIENEDVYGEDPLHRRVRNGFPAGMGRQNSSHVGVVYHGKAVHTHPYRGFAWGSARTHALRC